MATDPIENLPCGDEEYAQGIEYLSTHCAAFQRYQCESREHVRRVVAFLAEADRWIKNSIGNRSMFPKHKPTVPDLQYIQTLHRYVMDELKTGITQKEVKP